MNRLDLAGQLVKAARLLMAEPAVLSSNLNLNEVRQQKNELFATLDAVEVEIIDSVMGSGSCMGMDPKKKSATNRIQLTRPRSKAKIIEDGQRIVNRLVRRGWLRFDPGPIDSFGFFHATHSAEQIWYELRRSSRHRYT